MITFVSGGARSGKSQYAEQLAKTIAEQSDRKYQCTRTLVYMATAKSPCSETDLEMVQRIERHRLQRDHLWQTIEEPYHIEHALANIERGSVVVLDCLTLWTSQLLYDRQLCQAEIAHKLKNMLDETYKRQLSLIVVSNDVNEGLPATTETVSEFMRILESIHHIVVQEADEVTQVIAGLPLHWKGGEQK